MWKKNILQKQVQDFKGSLLIQNISKNAFTFSQSIGFCMLKLETSQPCQNILEMNFHMNFDYFQEWLEATTTSMCTK